MFWRKYLVRKLNCASMFYGDILEIGLIICQNLFFSKWCQFLNQQTHFLKNKNKQHYNVWFKIRPKHLVICQLPCYYIHVGKIELPYFRTLTMLMKMVLLNETAQFQNFYKTTSWTCHLLLTIDEYEDKNDKN